MRVLGRDWTRIRRDTTLGRILRWPLRLVPKNVPLPILSGPCRGMRWTLESGIYSCWLGTYEQQKQSRLIEFIREGMTVYDIGAHTGFYTLLFSRAVGLKGRVFSFEPFPENARRLERHIHINRIQNAVLIRAAVSQASGTAPFEAGRTPYTGQLSDTGAIQVQAVSLDEFIGDQSLPDLIKMDIEGGEAAALAGAEKLLSEVRPVWFIALHDDAARQACGDMLRKHGYGLHDLEGSSLPSIPSAATEIFAVPERP